MVVKDVDIFVSVRSRVFVPEAEGVANLVQDGRRARTGGGAGGWASGGSGREPQAALGEGDPLSAQVQEANIRAATV